MNQLQFDLFDEVIFNPKKRDTSGSFLGSVILVRRLKTGGTVRILLFVNKRADGVSFSLPPFREGHDHPEAHNLKRWIYDLILEEGSLKRILAGWIRQGKDFSQGLSLSKEQYLAFMAQKKAREAGRGETDNVTIGTTTPKDA
jgi:hypothetical protein